MPDVADIVAEPTNAAAAADEPSEPREPRDGVPALITDPAALADYAAAVATGSGPLALDAERASGFRYHQRAYLVQVRREGAGTALIDPIAVPDLGPLQRASASVEWILHAATQDLPCLAEVGLRPSAIFDTELAGRLLGRERVSLAALVGSELGEHLEKGHGAADWSARPLSRAQLRYAALDVEWLIELREVLRAELGAAGKLDWAEQEFDALLTFTPRDRGEEPWRRTSGIHRLRKPRSVAVARGLWQARDAVAQRIDIAPGRVLPDAAIIAAAQAMPSSIDDLSALPEFAGRGQQRRAQTWWKAIERARALPDGDLPLVATPAVGPPPARAWADRDPAAAARLQAARAGMTATAERIGMPVENVLSPELLRQVCWQPPVETDLTDGSGALADALSAELARGGARPWQVELAVPVLVSALQGEPS